MEKTCSFLVVFVSSSGPCWGRVLPRGGRSAPPCHHPAPDPGHGPGVTGSLLPSVPATTRGWVQDTDPVPGGVQAHVQGRMEDTEPVPGWVPVPTAPILGPFQRRAGLGDV